MSTVLTKLVPGETPGTYVEEEGTLIDFINPLVPSATPTGAALKTISFAFLLKLVLG